MKIERWVIMVNWPKMNHDGHLWQKPGWAQFGKNDFYTTKAKATADRNKYFKRSAYHMTKIVPLRGAV